MFRVNYGFNIGKGFLFGEEEISKLMKSLCSNPEIQDKMIKSSEQNRLDVSFALGSSLLLFLLFCYYYYCCT